MLVKLPAEGTGLRPRLDSRRHGNGRWRSDSARKRGIRRGGCALCHGGRSHIAPETTGGHAPVFYGRGDRGSSVIIAVSTTKLQNVTQSGVMTWELMTDVKTVKSK
jgi:hypothetical protein